MQKLLCCLLLCVPAAALAAAAQDAPHPRHEVDFAVTYNATRGTSVNGAAFWEKGAAIDLSAEAYHGFGLALGVSSGRASNIGGSGINITTITTVAGPRYTFRRHRLALFGEGLAGESNSFDSLFPSPQGATSSYNSLATQLGGGVDFTFGHHLALRALQANWLRTQFPNSTTNVQNTLQIGAGVVFRLQR